MQPVIPFSCNFISQIAFWICKIVITHKITSMHKNVLVPVCYGCLEMVGDLLAHCGILCELKDCCEWTRLLCYYHQGIRILANALVSFARRI